MSLVKDIETARELKDRLIKRKFVNDVMVIGHLSACVEGECDTYHHIHDDEQIPVNIGILLKVR